MNNDIQGDLQYYWGPTWLPIQILSASTWKCQLDTAMKIVDYIPPYYGVLSDYELTMGSQT